EGRVRGRCRNTGSPRKGEGAESEWVWWTGADPSPIMGASSSTLQTAELLLLLLIVVAGLVTLARRVHTPYPVLLLIGGLGLGVLPGAPRLELAPDAILLLVLPPIVYVAAFFTPIRSFRADIGNVASLAVGLVLASTAAVAAVALALVPGMTLPMAIALGAIVSPPDEVAAMAVMERLAVPRRLIALLQGESLLNDATALTVYRVALAA